MNGQTPGFEEPTRTFVLVFEDDDYAGAEVVCRRRVPMRVYFDISKAQGSQDVVVIEESLRTFGDRVLQSWNVTSGGKALPANGDGMIDISPEFAMLILTAWSRAVSAVPRPLAPPSPAGEPFPEQSIPMVALSESLPS